MFSTEILGAHTGLAMGSEWRSRNRMKTQERGAIEQEVTTRLVVRVDEQCFRVLVCLSGFVFSE